MSYQCYYVDENGDRCEKVQEDCWCSELHRKLEQGTRYGDSRPKGERQMSIEEMQRRLRRMGSR